MAKKGKGNRVQVILECTEHKDSGLVFISVADFSIPAHIVN